MPPKKRSAKGGKSPGKRGDKKGGAGGKGGKGGKGGGKGKGKGGGGGGRGAAAAVKRDSSVSGAPHVSFADISAKDIAEGRAPADWRDSKEAALYTACADARGKLAHVEMALGRGANVNGTHPVVREAARRAKLRRQVSRQRVDSVAKGQEADWYAF